MVSTAGWVNLVITRMVRLTASLLKAAIRRRRSVDRLSRRPLRP